jgi:hypothetical protein
MTSIGAPSPRAIRSLAREPVLVRLTHPEAHADENPLALLAEAPGAKDALLRPLRPDVEEDRVEE